MDVIAQNYDKIKISEEIGHFVVILKRLKITANIGFFIKAPTKMVVLRFGALD